MLRLSTEGADQVICNLRADATESAAAGRAYDALIKAQPALAVGAERAEQALRKNVDAMRRELGQLGSAIDAASGGFTRFGSALASPATAIAVLSASAIAGGVAIARFGDEYTVTMNMADPSVRVWLDRLAGAQEVNLDDKRTMAGLQIMEAAGLLGRGRIAEIVT